MIFAFGPFELDDSAGTLRRRDEVVALQPRVYNVLCYLLQHRDRVVSAQELTNVFWDGRAVNRGAVPWTIGHARKALASGEQGERFIETVRQRGYRFAGTVIERRAHGSDRPRAREIAERLSDTLVGRETIVSELHAAWAAARGGRGAMLLLSGDAGSGKTRLAAELAQAARTIGVEPWIGYGEGNTPSPLSCFADVMSQAQSDASVSGTLFDEASSLLDGLQAHAPLVDGSFWLSDRISRFIMHAAREQPRLIVLDDLHRAGEVALRVLDLLMLELRRSRLLIVATARELATREGDHAAAQLSLRYRECEEVRVASLSRLDVERYLTQTLGAPPSAALSQAVYEKTDGVPRFVRDVAHTLASRRAQGLPARTADVALPESAREAIHERLALIAPVTRRVLESAAARGGDIEVISLAAATGLSVTEVLRAIEQAIAMRILCTLADAPRYAFAMPLARAVLSERGYSMPPRPGAIDALNGGITAKSGG